MSGYHLGCLQVHGPIQSDDATESRQRINVIGDLEGLRETVGGRDPAGIGVLDHDHGRPFELP